MKGAAKKEFLKSLNIKKSEITADNYEEIIDKKLTTKVLYDFLIDRLDIMEADDITFVETLLLWKRPNFGSYRVDYRHEERLEKLKNKLNVAAITDVDKAFSYAFIYYTNPKYENCCRNTDDLYKLVSRLGKGDLLEQAILDHLITHRQLTRNVNTLMCFNFYQNYMNNNIKDEPLNSTYSKYKDLMDIMTNQHNLIIERAEAKVKREKIKGQLDALDTNSILDTITDMSVDKLKAAYPYCAVIRSTYSSGWAQDAFQVSVSYYFTNLPKGEIKKYLKEHGVNVKNTDSGYYDNGYSSHYEYGGTARGRKTNSYEFVASSEVGDIKVGNDYIYSAWTAGTSKTSYVHVVAKPTDDGNQYFIKSRPAKLYFNKDHSPIIDTNIFGEIVNEWRSVSRFYEVHINEETKFLHDLDEYLDDIKHNVNNEEVRYEVNGHFYVNNPSSNENFCVDGEKMSENVVDIIRTQYNLKVTAHHCDYFCIKADTSSEKSKLIEFLETTTKTGIATTLPESEDRYIIAKEDDANYYLIKKKEIITDSSKFYPISKSLFKEFFEKV